mgnify:CR=1 FL=1
MANKTDGALRDKFDVVHDLNMDSREIHTALTESEYALIAHAVECEEARGVNIDGVAGVEVDVPGTGIALPLYHGDVCVGALYMQSPNENWLTLGDVLFLGSATQYLGVVIGQE